MCLTRTALSVASIVLLFAVPLACGGEERAVGPVKPGEDVDGMIVTTGTSGGRDIFEFCEAVVTRPGIYDRRCTVPALRQLGLGYGTLAPTRRELGHEWQEQRWEATLDGRPLDLGAFGVLPDRRIIEPAAGGLVWLRQWNVVLTDPTPGPHTLRYVTRDAQGTGDVTWTFTVRN